MILGVDPYFVKEETEAKGELLTGLYFQDCLVVVKIVKIIYPESLNLKTGTYLIDLFCFRIYGQCV